MELSEALFIFFAGVLAHSFGIRLFGVWTKTLLYKITFINCLAILKFTENVSKKMLESAEVGHEQTLDVIFEHWQKMALYSLKNVIPDGVWQQIAVEDWRQAMKILEVLENKGPGAGNEN